jgi:hypothetical protein
MMTCWKVVIPSTNPVGETCSTTHDGRFEYVSVGDGDILYVVSDSLERVAQEFPHADAITKEGSAVVLESNQ